MAGTKHSKQWEQLGFAVVSTVTEAGGMPMLHAFKVTDWEAQREREQAMALPEHLRESLQVVPATLTFTLED